jgi:acyl carrier protein
MTTTEIKTSIREFLSRFFRNHELRDDEDIFALGFVNSLFAMQLVLFIEQEFNVQVGEEDLDLENFNTVNAMTALVARKTAPAVGA